MPDRAFYKLDVQGIVYLVDPTTSIAYTYDLEAPVAMGKLIWTDPRDLPQIQLREDWQSVLTNKLSSTGTTATPVAHATS
jgi:hypothetical protein